ncbi:hypothetical protein Tco_1407757 [Tanacetum coccineum]
MDSNPSQTSASTPVVAEMHKEDLQATGGPTSLGVTSEARANPQLSSVKEMYKSYELMENELAETSQKNAKFNEEFDRLFEAFLANDGKICVVYSCVEIDNEILREKIKSISKESKDCIDDGYWLASKDDDDKLLVIISLDMSLLASVAEVPSASALHVLRRFGSIFTSVYAAKLKHVVSLLEGLQGGKKIALFQKE